MQVGQRLLRADLDQHGLRFGHEVLDEIDVPDRMGHVGHQVPANLGRVGDAAIGRHAEHRRAGAADFDASQGLFEPPGRLLHQRRVERAGHGQQPRLARLALGQRGQFRQRLVHPPTTTWSGAL